MTIEPLESKHVEDASLLFTRRYRGCRERKPLLPSRCGRKEIAAFLLKEIIKENRGAAALSGRYTGGCTRTWPACGSGRDASPMP